MGDTRKRFWRRKLCGTPIALTVTLTPTSSSHHQKREEGNKKGGGLTTNMKKRGMDAFL